MQVLWRYVRAEGDIYMIIHQHVPIRKHEKTKQILCPNHYFHNIIAAKQNMSDV